MDYFETWFKDINIHNKSIDSNTLDAFYKKKSLNELMHESKQPKQPINNETKEELDTPSAYCSKLNYESAKFKQFIQTNLKFCCYNDVFIISEEQKGFSLMCTECFSEQTFIYYKFYDASYIYIDGATLISPKKYEKLYDPLNTLKYFPLESKEFTNDYLIKMHYRHKSFSDMENDLKFNILNPKKYTLRVLYIKSKHKLGITRPMYYQPLLIEDYKGVNVSPFSHPLVNSPQQPIIPPPSIQARPPLISKPYTQKPYKHPPFTTSPDHLQDYYDNERWHLHRNGAK